MSKTVTVLGAGAFGTALAISISRDGMPVTLWGRNTTTMAAMQQDRTCPRLPGVTLPDALTCAAQLADLPPDGPILLATPMQTLRQVLDDHRSLLTGRPLVLTCKGLELSTGLRPSQVLKEVLADAHPAILTGPSFAADIAHGLPTALTLACTDANLGHQLQQQLSTANLRLYATTDVTGAELGGALKNVIAIACGTAIGAGLGESARASLMTRGYAEMQRLALALGGRAETLAGLSGFGDLTLTCTSEQSRNCRLGLSIGQGKPFDPAVTVEGAATARATHALAERLGLDMPITAVTCGLVNGTLDAPAAMTHLLSRPLRDETD